MLLRRETLEMAVLTSELGLSVCKLEQNGKGMAWMLDGGGSSVGGRDLLIANYSFLCN